MVRAKNYETASTFAKVIQRKLLAFFPETVYRFSFNSPLISLGEIAFFISATSICISSMCSKHSQLVTSMSVE